MMSPEIASFFDAVQHSLGVSRLQDILALRDTPIEKADGSYVTQGDLLVQSLIGEFAVVHLHKPLLVSEEMENAPGAPPGDATVVVVDPIDGTENFTSGLPEWGVSIACYNDGVHRGSMLGAPEMGRWLRTGDSVQRFRSRIRGLSSSLSREQIMQVGIGPEYRMMGCCVVNMMNVIQGSYLTFENPKGTNTWDILAGINLALEHGLKVEVDGRGYRGEYLLPGVRYRFKVGEE